MVQTDSQSSPSDGPPGGIAPNLAAATKPTSSGSFVRLLALAIAAGLLAGVASVLAGEQVLDRYRGDLVPAIKNRPSPEDMRRWKDARVQSATWTFAALGAVMGMTMGLAGGLARRAVLASVGAAIGGLLLGTAATTSLALVLVPNFFKSHDPQSTDLVLPLLTHGAIWGAAGAVGGLAFGLGLGGKGRWKATLTGGLLGAAGATVVYEIVGAIAFASSKTDLPVSSSITTRAMAMLLVAILSAMGAALALRLSPKREPFSSVSP